MILKKQKALLDLSDDSISATLNVCGNKEDVIPSCIESTWIFQLSDDTGTIDATVATDDVVNLCESMRLRKPVHIPLFCEYAILISKYCVVPKGHLFMGKYNDTVEEYNYRVNIIANVNPVALSWILLQRHNSSNMV